MSSTEDSKSNSKKTGLQPQQQPQQQQQQTNAQKTRLGILPSENIKEKQVCTKNKIYKLIIYFLLCGLCLFL